MLQVYDRVISSASEMTLVMLTIALLLAFMALAGLDAVRARVLTRASVRLDHLIAARVMTAIIDRSASFGGARSQLLRDFDTFRQFITGIGIHAIFDLPWAPIYILVIFVLHPVLGAFALGCSLLLILMAFLNEWFVKPPLTESNEAASRNYSFTEMSLRNREVVRAMGMIGGLLKRWSRDRNRMLERQVTASDLAATMQSVIRFLRLSMQSLILGLGAYLVIERLATVGAMFAASILLGRALQPVEQIVGSWRNLVSARSAFLRVRELLAANPAPRKRPDAAAAGRAPFVEALSFVPPLSNKPILRGVSFASSRARCSASLAPPAPASPPWRVSSWASQTFRGGGPASMGQMYRSGAERSLGQHLGYLPQDIELFADTVAANISRFQEGEDAKTILAAQMAGVHDMILRLADGYDTQVGEGGAILSGGYRQRVGLARAVYGNPSLIVLDEPSSNFDADGDAALTDCIMQLKKRRDTVVIISHRPSTIGVVDKVLVSGTASPRCSDRAPKSCRG